MPEVVEALGTIPTLHNTQKNEVFETARVLKIVLVVKRTSVYLGCEMLPGPDRKPAFESVAGG